MLTWFPLQNGIQLHRSCVGSQRTCMTACREQHMTRGEGCVKVGELPAQLAATNDLERAGHRVVEQLLDLEAVAGGAVGVPAGACMHQQRHCARHLPIPLIPLSVRHARRGLVNFPCMRLHVTRYTNSAPRKCVQNPRPYCSGWYVLLVFIRGLCAPAHPNCLSLSLADES